VSSASCEQQLAGKRDSVAAYLCSEGRRLDLAAKLVRRHLT